MNRALATLTLVAILLGGCQAKAHAYDTLQAQLDQGGVIDLGGATVTHGGPLYVNQPGTTLRNGTLVATDPAASAVEVRGAGVTLQDLTVDTQWPAARQRYFTLDQMGVGVWNAPNFTARNVTVHDAAAAGMYLHGAANFLLDHVTAVGPQADGIHMTGGSGPGTVTSPVVRSTSDDGISVISYLADKAITHNITITNPTVSDTLGAGIDISGAESVGVTNVNISNTGRAGVLVASLAAPWYTYYSHTVNVIGGTITGANYLAPSVQHGAITVAPCNPGQVVRLVLFSALKIVNTSPRAIADYMIQVPTSTLPALITFQRLSVFGGPARVFWTNAPASSYRRI